MKRYLIIPILLLVASQAQAQVYDMVFARIVADYNRIRGLEYQAQGGREETWRAAPPTSGSTPVEYIIRIEYVQPAYPMPIPVDYPEQFDQPVRVWIPTDSQMSTMVWFAGVDSLGRQGPWSEVGQYPGQPGQPVEIGEGE